MIRHILFFILMVIFAPVAAKAGYDAGRRGVEQYRKDGIRDNSYRYCPPQTESTQEKHSESHFETSREIEDDEGTQETIKELKALLNHLLDSTPEFRRLKYSSWFTFVLSRFEHHMYTKNYLEAKNDLGDLILFDLSDPRVRWHLENLVDEFYWAL